MRSRSTTAAWRSRDKGDLDRAIADFSKVAQLEPKNAQAFNNLGLAYRSKGDLDRALASFEQAIKLDAGAGGRPSAAAAPPTA